MILHPRSDRLHRGMTLLEVLVAMAIFLIALAALSQLITIGSTDALDASFQSDGSRLAQSKLAEIEAGALAPDSSITGTFDTEVGWQWQMESSQTSVPNVFLVTVTVSRQPGGKSFSTKMSQMVYDSRQMGKSGEIAKPTTGTTGAASP